jgi:hypothetical protein
MAVIDSSGATTHKPPTKWASRKDLTHDHTD